MLKTIAASLILAATLSSCAPPPQMPAVPALNHALGIPAQTVTDPSIVNALREAFKKERAPGQAALEGDIKTLTVQQPFADNPDLLTYSGTVETTTPNGGGLFHFVGAWRPKIDDGAYPILALHPGVHEAATASELDKQKVIQQLLSAPSTTAIEGLDVARLNADDQPELLVYTTVLTMKDQVSLNSQRYSMSGYLAPGHGKQTSAALGTPVPIK